MYKQQIIQLELRKCTHFLHYFPKRAECLNKVKRVLDLPELEIVRLSDTCWLAHEWCVKAVKATYGAIVMALDNIFETTHEPEALGISKGLCKKSTIAAIFLLDYTLPQVTKLSKTLCDDCAFGFTGNNIKPSLLLCLTVYIQSQLRVDISDTLVTKYTRAESISVKPTFHSSIYHTKQTENLDVTAIADLVDATLNALDNAVLPSANWVLELLEANEALEALTDTTITAEDICLFKKKSLNLLCVT